MTRRPLYLFCAALVLAACNRAPQNKGAIRESIIEHLKKSAALDLNQIDVAVEDVKYQGNQATAMVAFKPKASPEAGMTMSYNLERRGNKWQVTGRGAGHGGGTMGGASGMMGGGAAGQGASGEMPPGHPPVNTPGTGAATKGGELPAGHPPVNTPAPKSK